MIVATASIIMTCAFGRPAELISRSASYKVGYDMLWVQQPPYPEPFQIMIYSFQEPRPCRPIEDPAL
jgi:hypothetical protein